MCTVCTWYFSVVSLRSSRLELEVRGEEQPLSGLDLNYQHSCFNFSTIILAMASCKPPSFPSSSRTGHLDGPVAITLSLGDGMIA